MGLLKLGEGRSVANSEEATFIYLGRIQLERTLTRKKKK